MTTLSRLRILALIVLSMPLQASPLFARQCPVLKLDNSGVFALREVDSALVQTQHLSDPPRFVVDLSHVTCVDTLQSSGPLTSEVERIRVGRHDSFTRIVFDLTHDDTEGSLIAKENETTVNFRRPSQPNTIGGSDAPELITQLSFREIMRLSSKRRGANKS